MEGGQRSRAEKLPLTWERRRESRGWSGSAERAAGGRPLQKHGIRALPTDLQIESSSEDEEEEDG